MNRAVATITRVEFRDFKGFRSMTLSLQHMNILVGPNNCGKSTVLDAFRTLDTGIRKARAKRPERVPGPGGQAVGYPLADEMLPMSIENVHTDYADVDSRVTFRLSNGNQLVLFFPIDGGCYLIPHSESGNITGPGDFSRAFPVRIAVIPVLGPVEHEEGLLTKDTVRRGLSTHRASRHFRNYWYYFGDGFEDFAALIRRTWPGMDIQPPERFDYGSKILSMFCLENRMTRELYWAGFGFQIWCQLLTHTARCSECSLLVVDEPEIYLHPDVQRQLLGILRDAGPDILMATHSSEIMGEADPSEIVLIDKTRRSAERLRDIEGVQEALEAIGSVQNITLTQLARNRRVLFVEGLDDFRLLRRFGRRAGLTELASGIDFTPVESGGFANWERVRSLGWGMEKTLGKALRLGAVFDRDYWPDEELLSIIEELRQYLQFAEIHRRKEIENYLLVPAVLQRGIERSVADHARRRNEPVPEVWSVRDVLHEITKPSRNQIQGQLIAKRATYFQRTGKDQATIASDAISLFEEQWEDLDTRMAVVPGKETLAAFRKRVQEDYSITLTDFRIIDNFQRDEIPGDLLALLEQLEGFRQA